jgi:hypothetical protein
MATLLLRPLTGTTGAEPSRSGQARRSWCPLRKSIHCTAAHTAANTARVAPLIANYGHASLHYGNMITYLRMTGIKPPSS